MLFAPSSCLPSLHRTDMCCPVYQLYHYLLIKHIALRLEHTSHGHTYMMDVDMMSFDPFRSHHHVIICQFWHLFHCDVRWCHSFHSIHVTEHYGAPPPPPSPSRQSPIASSETWLWDFAHQNMPHSRSPGIKGLGGVKKKTTEKTAINFTLLFFPIHNSLLHVKLGSPGSTKKKRKKTQPRHFYLIWCYEMALDGAEQVAPTAVLACPRPTHPASARSGSVYRSFTKNRGFLQWSLYY